jgi:hypothetical protein
MTFACSRRSLVATALAAGLVLPVAASAAGPRPSPSPGGGHHGSTAGPRPSPSPGGGHHGSTSGGSQRPSTSRHQVSGILKGMPGTTMPTALTVLQADGTMITVIVPTTTKVVRGYGAQSSLDEFAGEDRISAQGSFVPGSTTTFKARWIKDWSIQRAYTRVVGSVLSVQSPPNSLTLQVARGGSQHRPYQRSQPMTVNLTSSTLKIVSGTATVSVDALRKDMRVLVLGVYNRTQSTLSAARVRILSAHRGLQVLNAAATAAPSPSPNPSPSP